MYQFTFSAESVCIMLDVCGGNDKQYIAGTYREVLLRNVNLESVVHCSQVEQVLRQLPQGGVAYVLHGNVHRLHHSQPVLSHPRIVVRYFRALFEKRKEWLNFGMSLEQPAL